MVWATTPTTKYQSGGSKYNSKLAWSHRRRNEVTDVSSHWAFPRIRRLAHWEPALPRGTKLPSYSRRSSPSPSRTRSVTPSGGQIQSDRKAAEKKARMNTQTTLPHSCGDDLQPNLTNIFTATSTSSGPERGGKSNPAMVLNSTMKERTVDGPKSRVSTLTALMQSNTTRLAKVQAAKEATQEKIIAYQVSSPTDVSSHISSGDVQFLSLAWLVNMPELWRVGRCQDLPKEAFLDPEEAAWLYDRLGGLVIVSYPWLTRTHPDPGGFHFHTLKLYLKVHQRHFRDFLSQVKPPSEHFRDIGVFWDYASLLQPSSKSGERLHQEQATFALGMRTIEYLYGGPMTVVVQLKTMPFTAFENMNRTPYDSRGWCCFEEVVAGTMKSPFQLLNLALVSDQLEQSNCQWQLVASGAQAERKSPMHPEQLRQELITKVFSSKEDCEILYSKYAEFFSHLAASTLEVSLPQQSHIASARPWGAKEVDLLVRALPEFSSCMKLNLRGRALGDVGAEKLAKVLQRMTSLETLWLNNCDIGNKGISALAPALPCLKHLVDLKLHGSRFTSIGVRELTDVTLFPWTESKETASGTQRAFLQLPRLEDLSLPLNLAETQAAEILERLTRKTENCSRLMIAWL